MPPPSAGAYLAVTPHHERNTKMTTLDRPATTDLLARVEDIRPIIEEHAERGEAERKIAPPVYEALRDAGFLRIWVPKAFGGLELHPAEAYPIFEALSAIDGAVGWNLNQHAAVSAIVSWFTDAHTELWDSPDRSFAGVFWPAGAAQEVDGGFRVTATVKFASNSQFADWFLVPAVVMENGQPRIDPETGGPDFLATIVPIGDAQVSDTWHTMGMRATASNDAVVDNVFVPAERAVRVFRPREVPQEVAGPVYRMLPWPGAQAHAAVPVGIARAAVGKLVKLAETKVPNFYETGLRDRQVAQYQVAEASALVEAASAYLGKTGTDAYDHVSTGAPLTVEHKMACQQAVTFAGSATLKAMSLVHQAAGSSGMRQEAGFEKLFRDANTITQHAGLQTARFESVGRIMFGHEPDWFAFQL
jgi:alkylation response protein AidB-like acyl-CoA dehydrogenase